MDFEKLIERARNYLDANPCFSEDYPVAEKILRDLANLASPAPLEPGKLLEGVKDTDDRDASRIFLEEFNKAVPLSAVEEECGKGIMSVLFYLRAFEKYLVLTKKEG
jgi:hypothetical protein